MTLPSPACFLSPDVRPDHRGILRSPVSEPGLMPIAVLPDAVIHVAGVRGSSGAIRKIMAETVAQSTSGYFGK
jgi:hypothetical protein